MNAPTTTIRKPEKIVVLDGSETGIIVKGSFRGAPIEDESNEKRYLIHRTDKKALLQMIGA